MVARCIFSYSDSKSCSSFYTCVDPHNIYGGDPSCHVQIFCDRGCQPWTTCRLFIFDKHTSELLRVVFLQGYFLIGFFGVLETALVAAGINLLIGLVCIVAFKKAEPGVPCGFGLPKPAFDRLQLDKENSLWLTISFLCGFTALAYEVVWTRLLVFSVSVVRSILLV